MQSLTSDLNDDVDFRLGQQQKIMSHGATGASATSVGSDYDPNSFLRDEFDDDLSLGASAYSSMTDPSHFASSIPTMLGQYAGVFENSQNSLSGHDESASHTVNAGDNTYVFSAPSQAVQQPQQQESQPPPQQPETQPAPEFHTPLQQPQAEQQQPATPLQLEQQQQEQQQTEQVQSNGGSTPAVVEGTSVQQGAVAADGQGGQDGEDRRAKPGSKSLKRKAHSGQTPNVSTDSDDGNQVFVSSGILMPVRTGLACFSELLFCSYFLWFIALFCGLIFECIFINQCVHAYGLQCCSSY